MPGRALRRRNCALLVMVLSPISESSSCPEGHYDLGAFDFGVFALGSADRNHPHARKGITTFPLARELGHILRWIGIILMPGRALRRDAVAGLPPAEAGSESSSCPEGHYDPFAHPGCRCHTCRIGIILMPGRALRRPLVPTSWHRSSSFIGIILMPGRALRRRPVWLKVDPDFVHRNHPHARKGITTLLPPRQRPHMRSSESSSCPEGHYDGDAQAEAVWL